MSRVTRSPKRNRAYPRKFDHDACWSLWNSDRDFWTWQRLAERFEVSPTAVRRVIDPRVRQTMNDTLKSWIRDNKREPCKGGCGRLVWMTRKEATGYCNQCRAQTRQADNVRADALRCTTCEEWKSDRDFAPARRGSSRRGRRWACRVCEAVARKERRRQRKIAQTAQESLDV